MLPRRALDASRRETAGKVGGKMLDHMGFAVADFAASRAFYLGALGAIGLQVVGEGDDRR